MELDKKFWKGMLLVVVGMVLLIDKLELIPSFIPSYFISWRSLLVIFGIFLLVTKQDKGPGLILITIGALFLSQHYLNFDPFDLWPLFIIAAGVGLLISKKKDLQANNNPDKTINFDRIEEVAIFSSGERTVSSSEFSGGTVTTIFGGSEINLLNSKLSPGRNVMEVFSMFGGVEMIIPSDWRVKMEVVVLFGGFSDKRNLSGSFASDTTKELVIKGFVLFGGGELKNYKK